MTTRTFPVEGMTCAACASTVENTAKKVEGVNQASVNLASEKLNVEIEENFNPERLEEAIDASGYKVLLPKQITKTFEVEGMTCASCASTIEKTAQKLTGMSEASVNLASEKMTVTFDPMALSVREISDAVHASGYEATPEREEAVQVDTSADEEKE